MKGLRKNLGLKIASIFVSLMLWLYVESQTLQNTTHTQIFTLNYDSLDNTQFAVTGKPPTTVAVQAEGSPQALHDLERTKADLFIADVQLQNARAGVDHYRIVVQRDPVRDFGIKYVQPDPISLHIAAIVRSLPRKVTFDENYGLPPGMYVSRADVSPETVILSGKKEDVAKVTEVRARVPWKDYKTGIVYDSALEFLDSSGKQVPGVQPNVTTVKVLPVLSPSDESQNVPVIVTYVGQLPTGYSVDLRAYRPTYVSLKGKHEFLLGIGQVETEPIDLGALTKSQSIDLRLKTPPRGVTCATKSVRVNLRVTRNVIQPAEPPIQPQKSSNPSQVPPLSTLGH